jgi:phage baseplate assembly protein gpV
MLRRPGDAGLGRPWSLPHRGEDVVLLTQNGQRPGMAVRRLKWDARGRVRGTGGRRT